MHILACILQICLAHLRVPPVETAIGLMPGMVVKESVDKAFTGAKSLAVYYSARENVFFVAP
jgi:hypothetical protein